jgi:catechol 2,3-dioxygenase-like lactoylglutathione lyase family enzyme
LRLDRLDHLVLTVANVEKTVAFYTGVLGLVEVSFSGNRKALVFGRQKINLHQKGAEIEPHARVPVPGSADLCFIAGTPLDGVIKILRQKAVPIELGPVERTGATGQMTSVYIRDPDFNLIEISNYL